MKTRILQWTALAFTLALSGALGCQSAGGQQGGSGCGGAGNSKDDSQCNAACGYGTYQYQCECRADPKYAASIANNNNSSNANNNNSNNNNH